MARVVSSSKFKVVNPTVSRRFYDWMVTQTRRRSASVHYTVYCRSATLEVARSTGETMFGVSWDLGTGTRTGSLTIQVPETSAESLIFRSGWNQAQILLLLQPLLDPRGEIRVDNTMITIHAFKGVQIGQLTGILPGFISENRDYLTRVMRLTLQLLREECGSVES